MKFLFVIFGYFGISVKIIASDVLASSEECAVERRKVATVASRQPISTMDFVRHLNVDEAFIHEINMQKNEVSAYVSISTFDIIDVGWNSSACHFQGSFLGVGRLAEQQVLQSTVLRFKSDEIFHPKFEFQNSFESFRVDDKRAYKPAIFDEVLGKLVLTMIGLDWGAAMENKSLLMVTYTNEIVFKCSLNMARYPHDKHECILAVAIDPTMLIANATVIAPFKPATTLKDPLKPLKERYIPMKTEIRHDPMPYHIQIVLKFKRDPVFELLTQLSPLFVISAMPIITFILPADSGEKMTVSLTTVLTYFVLSISFFDGMPESEKIPYVGAVFIYMIFTALMTTVAAAFVVRHDSHQDTKEKDRINKNPPNDTDPDVVTPKPRKESKQDACANRISLNDRMLILSIIFNLIIPWTVLIVLLIPPNPNE